MAGGLRPDPHPPPRDGVGLRPTPRSVIIVAFPDVQALDVVGPLEVFAMANRYGADPAYATALVSASGQPITTSSGLSLGTEGPPAGSRSTRCWWPAATAPPPPWPTTA